MAIAIGEQTNGAALFRVARTMPVDLPERRRCQRDIWVPAGADRDAVIAALLVAAREALRADPEVAAVCVFASADDGPVNQGFNRGRAWLSRDGNGWTGDGRFPPYDECSDDHGDILVTIGDPRERMEHLRVEALSDEQMQTRIAQR